MGRYDSPHALSPGSTGTETFRCRLNARVSASRPVYDWSIANPRHELPFPFIADPPAFSVGIEAPERRGAPSLIFLFYIPNYLVSRGTYEDYFNAQYLTNRRPGDGYMPPGSPLIAEYTPNRISIENDIERVNPDHVPLHWAAFAYNLLPHARYRLYWCEAFDAASMGASVSLPFNPEFPNDPTWATGTAPEGYFYSECKYLEFRAAKSWHYLGFTGPENPWREAAAQGLTTNPLTDLFSQYAPQFAFRCNPRSGLPGLTLTFQGEPRPLAPGLSVPMAFCSTLRAPRNANDYHDYLTDHLEFASVAAPHGIGYAGANLAIQPTPIRA